MHVRMATWVKQVERSLGSLLVEVGGFFIFDSGGRESRVCVAELWSCRFRMLGR